MLCPGCGLRGVRVPVEQQVARRLCLGWLVASVQLAPRPDGDGSGGAVWQRWVAFQIKLMSFISVSHFSSSSKQSGCISVIAHPRLGIDVVYNFKHDFSSVQHEVTSAVTVWPQLHGTGHYTAAVNSSTFFCHLLLGCNTLYYNKKQFQYFFF